MARNVLLETDYTFNPSTYTLTIKNRWIRPERVMLISNVTKNVVLYNFSDSTKSFTSYTKTDNVGAATFNTVIVLNSTPFTTTTMSSTDYIQIYIDDYATTVYPEETLLDGAQKQRVSQPQSLMDTDFEYSVQPSKWEAIFLASNYPTFFAKPNGGNAIAISSLVGDGTSSRSIVTVTTTVPHGLYPGGVINVQETLNYRAEGTFTVLSTPSIYTMTYRARGVVTGDVNYANLSSVYAGDVFDGAHIPGGNYPGLGSISAATNTMNTFIAQTDGSIPSNITITFNYPHGLYPGMTVSVSGTNAWDGDYAIKQVPTANQIVVLANQQYGSLFTPSTSRIIVKPDGYVIHRPYDAGVAITTYNNVLGLQAIRQTRRYFRYQAGKSVQFSTGAKLTPTFNIDAISIDSINAGLRTVTVTTVEDHGLQAGAVVYLENVTVGNATQYNPFNGQFTVTNVTNSNVFQFQTTITSGLSTADLNPTGQSAYAHAINWVGAECRTGMYDEQNGFYFSYNGQVMTVVRRHSEKLLSGRLNLVQNSPVVTGVGTSFRKQLIVGNKIVIKGSSYLVTAISSDTLMYIAPAYKGSTSNGNRATVTQSISFPQSQWNMDKCDGTGPSGYVLDVKRMQMVYIDYSWYGAGTIRFGVRGPRGQIIYVHRISNNNVNQLAYQKAGNLPARYEVDNSPIAVSKMVAGPSGTIGSALAPTDTTLYVNDVSYWPSTGTILVRDDQNVEIMNYSAVGAFNSTAQGYPITISGRRQYVTQALPDVLFTYTATQNSVTFIADSSATGTGGNAQVSVQPINQTCAPIIQHWGSSVVMDGGFQTDLLPINTAGMTKYATIQAGTTRPLLAIRVAPSADNGIARNYGVRELINRMALQLQSVAVQTNGSYRIDCILNPGYMTYTNWTAAQLAFNRTTVNGSSGSANITITDTGTLNTTSVTGMAVGMLVGGNGNIPAGAYITNIQGNVVTLNVTLTGTITNGTVTFTPTSGYSGLPTDWTRDQVGASSLAQTIYFDNTGPGQGQVPYTTASPAPSGIVVGGDSVFSFYTENGSGTSFNSSVYSLVGGKDIGNSALSGNGNISTPGFPNGPDVLVITATNIGTATSQIAARLSWTEAQA